MDKMIVPMIVDRIVAGLTKACITDIPFGDPTKLDAIKSGRFQEDPNTKSFRASVQGGDLEDPDLRDGIVTLREGQSMRTGFYVEPREFGGRNTQMWYRRGIVRLEFYFIVEQKQEEPSRNIAYAMLGRIQNNIEKIYVADLYDDFGEHAVKLFSTQNSFFQSGGPPTSYLWRGKVIWECLTEREWN